MFEDHCQIVQESLVGERAVDGQSFASLAILGERLRRLKEADEIFAGVEFSPEAKSLRTSKAMAAVG